MSLEQAMAEVRQYLEARNSATAGLAEEMPQAAASAGQPPQFTMQSELISRLSEIAARLGQVEPNSKMGPPGVFLKRVLRKAIGWYSRPAQQFDHATLELLRQLRHDMLLLQQQITALQQAARSSSPAAPDISAGDDAEACSLMIELFKNAAAVKEVRQHLREEHPRLLQRYEPLLNKSEQETQDLMVALLRRLDVHK